MCAYFIRNSEQPSNCQFQQHRRQIWTLTSNFKHNTCKTWQQNETIPPHGLVQASYRESCTSGLKQTTAKYNCRLAGAIINLTIIRNVSICQGLQCRCYCSHNQQLMSDVKYPWQQGEKNISGETVTVQHSRLAVVIPYQHFRMFHQSHLQGSTSLLKTDQ
jgi:hypothetical protein